MPTMPFCILHGMHHACVEEPQHNGLHDCQGGCFQAGLFKGVRVQVQGLCTSMHTLVHMHFNTLLNPGSVVAARYQQNPSVGTC